MCLYFRYASTAYSSNQEDQSFMVLTILELWIALDKFACASYPLLISYSPEVPLDKGENGKALLRHLLFRKADDLARLKAVDAYIRERRHYSKYDISVFSNKSSSQSFCSKFYDSPAGAGAGMPAMRERIEKDADKKRQVVLAELRVEMKKYRVLTERIEALEHLHGDEEDSELCQFLGLHTGEEEPMVIDGEPYAVQSDGFVRPGRHRESMGFKECRFDESPIPFLQELIGLRRKGTGYLPTHLGKIVHGRLLTADDIDY
ncbi:hypothetical protein D9758_008213 [Tetrapyrgos nigripes]|uniref:Uncharacterized protein n=1 Tax=Tetrapyrgos nigripes TaxID=182062 RepID=A0A8H5G1G6_9AGAR|nr:hypothetical protein D9758_008213 [Tetrapyrgos nigripes]